ncbi:MAG: nucleotidyltransferase domain-containing protein [Candidatus Woesearchaeota archaeon]
MVKFRIMSFTGLRVIYLLFNHRDGMTIKEIAKTLKLDYKNTHNSIRDLTNEGIIRKQKIGNYNLCKTNYQNEELILYLKQYNHYRKFLLRKKHSTEYNILKESIEKIKNEMGPFFIYLVFGSYSKGVEKSGSDIDILFLTFSSGGEKIISKILNKVNAPYQKKFHLIEQNILDFIRDLKERTELSIAQELNKESPIVLYGDDIYFNVIIENKKNES